MGQIYISSGVYNTSGLVWFFQAGLRYGKNRLENIFKFTNNIYCYHAKCETFANTRSNENKG